LKPELTELAAGLDFPEGPIALSDGSVIVVEIRAGRLTKIHPDGTRNTLAELGGGPNGAAIGPDGWVYICNNGGLEWHDMAGIVVPGNQPLDYSGGSIQRVDPATGTVETLYDRCGDLMLKGPNDIVFDSTGGFWFTDHGKQRERDRDRTGIFYAQPDGSAIDEVIFPVDGPNGIGLSPDQKRLYVAETFTGRLFAWNLEAPGQIRANPASANGGYFVAGLPGMQLFDSLAVDSAGNICVATLINGGITIISPDGQSIRHITMPDPFTTNICFGGAELRTAYITLSGTGRLVATEWEIPGLALAF
jgi:gluconolactonase